MNNCLQPVHGPVDLSNCEREPIHIPDRIQPHGVLLAVDPTSLAVVQWSANACQLLGVPVEQLPKCRLEELVDSATLSRAQRLVRQGRPAAMTPLQTAFHHNPQTGKHLGTAHIYDGVLILEFELRATQQLLLHDTVGEGTESITRFVQQATTRLQVSSSLSELYQALADEVRRLSGFDRVMVYRFMPDQHGVVEGESLREGLEPFLGLHYPASDIPPQARRLYTLNPLRLIVDVNAQPVPLEPQACPIHGRSLDLTYSSFRSVSPIHIEYLQNMGVAASMSISILSGGQLWGLIACHHYQPRNVSFEIRAACELLGTMAGGYVTTRQISDEVELQTQRQDELGLAMRSLGGFTTIDAGLKKVAPQLLRAVDAQGAAICVRERITLVGQTPPLEFVRGLNAALAKTLKGAVWSSQQLANDYPPAAEFADLASGALVLPLGLEPMEMLIFFRPQYVTEVKWGGNPEKSAEMTEDGLRLSPRKSFAQWTQTVRLQSRPWSRVDHTIATDMHVGLLRLMAQRAAELLRVNEELLRINSDLDSFAYAASHDLKEPLRTINQTLFFLERALADGRPDEVNRRISAIQRTTERMTELLEGLLRVSRAGSSDLHLEPTDLAEVAREAAEIALSQLDGEALELVVHPLPQTVADFMCIRDVFQNLFSNARKYSDGPQKRIEVGSLVAEPAHAPPAAALGKQAVYVRDNGIGIASERLIDIFQVFRRLHQVGDYGGGSGVGLAIVKRIIERHGGVVWATSEPGKGSTFYFTLEANAHGEA
ncbi:MAG: ATP-binding protein [Aureliella sp.]